MKYVAEIISNIEDLIARLGAVELEVAKLAAVRGVGKPYIKKLAKRVKALEDARVGMTLPEDD